MTEQKLEQIISRHKVLICVGSGGVGKTTISAALGVLAANMGKKVLVMTIDPSRRLKDALNLNSEINNVVRVRGEYRGELYASVLHAEKIFDEFITQASVEPELTQKLLKNKLYKQLSTTLSGSQEFTSLLQLTKIVDQHELDLVILDTPPAQHAVEFLEAPKKIGALFQDSVVQWFVGGESVGFFRKIISRGTQLVLTALEKITGATFMHELNEFFQSVRVVQKKISEKTKRVNEILASSTTGFILVSGFDKVKLHEAEQLNAYLADKQFHLVAAVINRAFPLWIRNENDAAQDKLALLYSQWRNYHAEREEIFNNFSLKWSKMLPVIRIPDLNKELIGLKGIEVVANEVANAFNAHDNRV